jgi:uncharacterized phage-associated protein
VHKLLYYCQAHHVAAFDVPLFVETISAWDMGPVVGQLWWHENQAAVGELVAPVEPKLSEAELNTIGYVLSRYGNLSGTDLERLTHSEDPWADADRLRRGQGTQSAPITLEALAAFFRREGDPEDGGPMPDHEKVTDWLKGAHARLRGPATEDTVERILARLR